MKILSNAHCHTTFCDGSNTPEEMIQAAIALNFVSLGFSIHGWAPYEPTPVTLEKEAAYRAELMRLREKYRGQIEIIIGAERDALFPRDFSAYEFLIDSTHWFQQDGNWFSVDCGERYMQRQVRECFGGDYYAYCKAYYRREAELCATSDALFIGHIDLVTKFNGSGKYFDENDPRYLNPAKEAAACAARRGIPLEMNSGAISRGYRSTPYPALPILKHFHDLGGEIIINSDAHSTDALDTAFDVCVDMARACGYDHVLRLRANGLEEIGLD